MGTKTSKQQVVTGKRRTERPSQAQQDASKAELQPYAERAVQRMSDADAGYDKAMLALGDARSQRVDAQVYLSRIAHHAKRAGVRTADDKLVRGTRSFAAWLSEISGAEVRETQVRPAWKVGTEASKVPAHDAEPTSAERKRITAILDDRKAQTTNGSGRKAQPEGNKGEDVSFSSLAKRVDKVTADLAKVEAGSADRDALVKAVAGLSKALAR